MAVFVLKLVKLSKSPLRALSPSRPWRLRNALVRANYNNYPKGIAATNEYLVRFFRNLLLGEENVLSNQDLQITSVQSAKMTL